MKKILFTILACAASIAAQAQSFSATLQQGDEITLYYGDMALVQAYNAAEDGAIITLSPGRFVPGFGSYIDFNKSITVIGSGGYGDDSSITYIDAILGIGANNVRVEGISVGNLQVGAVSNTTILHSYITGSIAFNTNSSNSILDQCTINYLESDEGQNTCIKNCIIEEIHQWKNGSVATFLNCIIYYGSNYDGWNDIFRNCVIGIPESSKQMKSPGEYYNNVFFYYDDNATHKDELVTINYGEGCVHENNTIDTYQNLFGGTVDLSAFPTTSALGDDNTKVGVEGGSGFKLYPAIPRILTKKIDRQTNAEGKINVSITVKAED